MRKPCSVTNVEGIGDQPTPLNILLKAVSGGLRRTSVERFLPKTDQGPVVTHLNIAPFLVIRSSRSIEPEGAADSSPVGVLTGSPAAYCTPTEERDCRGV